MGVPARVKWIPIEWHSVLHTQTDEYYFFFLLLYIFLYFFIFLLLCLLLFTLLMQTCYKSYT